MNRANVAVLLIAATVLIAALSGQNKQPQPSPQTGGRYQLFAAEHTMFGMQTSEKVILRIDTQTGNVDQWISGQGIKNPADLVDTWQRAGDAPFRRSK
jgi:hypothetical protein